MSQISETVVLMKTKWTLTSLRFSSTNATAYAMTTMRITSLVTTLRSPGGRPTCASSGASGSPSERRRNRTEEV